MNQSNPLPKLWRLYLFLVILSFIVFSFDQKLYLKKGALTKLQDISVDSASSDPSKNKIKELSVPATVNNCDLHFAFDFTATSTPTHTNLFQTAPDNRGVRLELSPAKDLVLILGSTLEAGYFVYYIDSQLELGKKYHLEIDITSTQHITIRYNRRKLVNADNKQINIEVSDVAIGTGFNKSRPFQGSIESFQFEFQSYRIKKGLKNFIENLKIILVILLTLLPLLLFRTKRNENASAH